MATHLSLAVTAAMSRSAVSTVVQTVGSVAAGARPKPGGTGTSVEPDALTCVPRLPAASPKTAWPTLRGLCVCPDAVAGGPTAMTMPEQSPPATATQQLNETHVCQNITSEICLKLRTQSLEQPKPLCSETKTTKSRMFSF